jgi:hypothetical protein
VCHEIVGAVFCSLTTEDVWSKRNVNCNAKHGSFPHLKQPGSPAMLPQRYGVAYYAARRRIETLGAQYYCSLTMGVLDGQSLLVFCWDPDVDERLPAIGDAIALLTGGTEQL